MQFDEPDEEEEGEGRNVTYEVRDEDEPDAEEDMGVEADYDGQLKTADGMDEYEDKKSGLHPREIDAHWIQRSLAKLAGYDADEAQRKAKTVLGILGVSIRFVSNRINPRRVDWTSNHMPRVVYCTGGRTS